MDGSDEPILPKCRFCRFGVGFGGASEGRKKDGTHSGAWGGLRHTPLRHSIVT